MDEIAEQGVAAFFVGNFNPAIVTPHWLASVGAISGREADKADVEVIHKSLSRFAFSGLKFDVTPEKFHIFAEAEPFVRLSDIVSLLFREAIPHTPISAASFNYYIHARLEDFEQRLRFGRKFAPVDPWGSLAPDFEGAKPEEVGGLVDLTVQLYRKDGVEGVTRIVLQPSNHIPEPSGIFIQVSETFEKLRDIEQLAAARASGKRKKAEVSDAGDEAGRQDGFYPKLLVEHFDAYLAKARKVTQEMLELGLQS